jgi:prephenate dehydrogenase
MMIQQLSIIGVGLIGGSLARALRQANVCNEIVGCGRNIDNLKKGVELGVIDRYTTDACEAVRGADVVMLAMPLGAFAQVMKTIAPALGDNTLITDGGSAKGCVVADARAHLGTHFPRFVAGHPIAGAECSGVEAAKVDLFQNRRVILTPTAETDSDAHARIKAMWQVTGAEVVDMDVQHHDEVLAATSHLPHMLAYTLVDMLANMESRREIFRYAAGGFRDFTRIASSEPRMWHDICRANRTEILNMLNEFESHLKHLKTAIQTEDSAAVEDIFKRAKIARDDFVA